MEGTPDTKPTHGDDKKMGGNSQSGSNGDTSRN